MCSANRNILLYATLAVVALDLSCVESSQEGAALFDASRTGIQGLVELLEGNLKIDLDFTELITNPLFWNQLPRNDCFVDGLEYSINTAWEYPDPAKANDPIIDQLGEAACSANWTSGRLDTWLACSEDSSNTACAQYTDGCVEASTSWSHDDIYTCDDDTYRLVPYSCELGDLSGKYGKLNISFDLYYEGFNSTDWEDLYEEIYNSTDFDDESVFNSTGGESDTFEEWKTSIYSPNLHIIRHDVAFWEIDYIAITPPKSSSIRSDHSLVISCGNGGERIACSAFEQIGASFTANPLTGDQVITISFKGNDYDQEFNEFYRLIDLSDDAYKDWQCIDYTQYHYGNETYNETEDEYPCIWQLFQIEISESGYEWTIPDEIQQLCNEYNVWIHQDWSTGELNATINDECSEELMGRIWDPTHSCIDGSGSDYCWNGYRCNDSFVDYDVLCRDAGADKFYCAVGDVSSRMGILNIDTQGTQDPITGIWTVTTFDDLSAPLYALPQRSIRLECVDVNAQVFVNSGPWGNDTFELTDICAVTVQTEGTVVTGPPIVIPATKAPTTPTPTVDPTTEPTQEPTTDPTSEPTTYPTSDPTIDPTPDPTESSESEEGLADLGTGGIIGIVAGIVVVVLLCCLCIWYFVVFKPRKEKEEATTGSIEVGKVTKMKSQSDEEVDPLKYDM